MFRRRWRIRAAAGRGTCCQQQATAATAAARRPDQVCTWYLICLLPCTLYLYLLPCTCICICQLPCTCSWYAWYPLLGITGMRTCKLFDKTWTLIRNVDLLQIDPEQQKFEVESACSLQLDHRRRHRHGHHHHGHYHRHGHHHNYDDHHRPDLNHWHADQRQVRRYLAEGKVKSYEQGELVVKLLEKVFTNIILVLILMLMKMSFIWANCIIVTAPSSSPPSPSSPLPS